jgi:predicted negative regulator of RcsB-dependent stress response
MADNANQQSGGLPGLDPSGGAPEQVSPLLQALQDNFKIVVAVAVVIVLAAGGWAAYDYNQKSKAEAAMNDLGAITAQMGSAAKIQELESFIATAPEPYGIGGSMELARTAFKVEDYETAAKAWEQLALSGDESMKTVARLGLARTRMLENRPGEALGLLEQLQQSAPKAFGKTILTEIAQAAEAAGNPDRALIAYQELMSDEQADRQYLEHKMKRILLRMMNKG